MKINGTQWVEIIRAISTAIIAIITTLCVHAFKRQQKQSKLNAKDRTNNNVKR
jgi:hypothetical protein